MNLVHVLGPEDVVKQAEDTLRQDFDAEFKENIF